MPPTLRIQPTLRTTRLTLRPVANKDVTALVAHWNEPRVGHWLWDGNPVDPRTVARIVDRSTHSFQTSGWGLWAVRPAGDPALIGVCGLCHSDHAPGIELLYSLAPTHWSKGLATEAVTAVLTHAFDTLGLQELLATTDDGNDASHRLLARLNAIPNGRVQVGDHTYPRFILRPPTPNHDPGYAPLRPL
jgi:[ribosomal protein S5]-alanine N-acetyltransferase